MSNKKSEQNHPPNRLLKGKVSSKNNSRQGGAESRKSKRKGQLFPTSLRFSLLETEKIKKDNLNKIIRYELRKLKDRPLRGCFLERHGLSKRLRARMLDWMIEVLSSFKCIQNSFFVAVDIMDGFIQRTKRTLSPDDIHLLGVTCMLLATKMEEIVPFKISTVVKKLTHGSMDAAVIRRMELEILVTLDFQMLRTPSLFIFLEQLQVRLNFHKKRGF
jgi:hypothetical protein